MYCLVPIYNIMYTERYHDGGGRYVTINRPPSPGAHHAQTTLDTIIISRRSIERMTVIVLYVYIYSLI